MEKNIVEEFKRQAEQRFPGELIRVVLFGSKVRGDATRESDVDVLVVIHSEGWRLGDQIRSLGYALELEHGVVLSIQVMSQRHYEDLRLFGSQFFKAVEREGVSV
ncbi:MAG: nucleotidyltransferase domain-containing protein [Nitrospira sp.]|nr:nucleotidyltransferase domain-containing protein [Nitrospira sp.]